MLARCRVDKACQQTGNKKKGVERRLHEVVYR